MNNMNVTMIENSEPDGNINWEEITDDSEENSSSSESVAMANEDTAEYSFSDMYGQTEENEFTYDPPASNTRRRKRAI